jgi:hypothetical protein
VKDSQKFTDKDKKASSDKKSLKSSKETDRMQVIVKVALNGVVHKTTVQKGSDPDWGEVFQLYANNC